MMVVALNFVITIHLYSQFYISNKGTDQFE